MKSIMPTRLAWLCALLFCLYLTTLPSQGATAVPVDEATKLHALLDEHWEWLLREYPEYATVYYSSDRYRDRLTDMSPAAVQARKKFLRDLLVRLDNIDAAKLAGQDHISRDMLHAIVANAVNIDKAYGTAPFGAGGVWMVDSAFTVSPMNGPQLFLPTLAKSLRFHNENDYQQYLKRLNAFPAQIDQLIMLLDGGIATGWLPPAVAMQQVPKQIDAHLVADVTQTPAWLPFSRLADNADLSAEQRQRLSAAGKLALEQSVQPAFRKLAAYMRERYIPACRNAIGAASLPGGPAFYQAMVAQQTTTALTAKEIHELGLREVARIGTEMNKTITRTGFTGTRAEFLQYLASDPRFFYTNPEDMLAGYRDIAKRADAELPHMFTELPRLSYGVRAMEPYEGDNAEHYTPGSMAAGRPGFFEANVNHLSRRGKPTMESLLLHEGVPGHHLQIARAQELSGLPPLRKNWFFVAYGEGWALYAESLGDEMGFYRDPYSKFGQLSSEMHRACRLVVDTGMHAFGWTREQAISYLEDNAALSHAFASAEVDRYLVMPGQALGYKIGELKIKALRAQAKTVLGERFDIRSFHNAVIDNGALPLDVLEAQINLWIAAEKAHT